MVTGWIGPFLNCCNGTEKRVEEMEALTGSSDRTCKMRQTLRRSARVTPRCILALLALLIIFTMGVRAGDGSELLASAAAPPVDPASPGEDISSSLLPRPLLQLQTFADIKANSVCFETRGKIHGHV